MGSESLQKKQKRVRPPRVHIMYEVHTGGAMQKVELPFVVGVMADLSAQRKEPLRALKDRDFVNIDRDNFNDVLNKAAPRLAMSVDNKLTNDNSKLAVELNFQNMDDFGPARVAEQVAPLRDLLEMRKQLDQLLSRMEGKDKFVELLEGIISNSEKRAQVAKELGIEAPSADNAGQQPEAPK